VSTGQHARAVVAGTSTPQTPQNEPASKIKQTIWTSQTMRVRSRSLCAVLHESRNIIQIRAMRSAMLEMQRSRSLHLVHACWSKESLATIEG
jgi:hypothetical protein